MTWADSMRRHGITNILIINGHAGNAGPVNERLDGYREQLGINIDFHSYWEAYSPEFVQEQMETGRCPGHAAEFETRLRGLPFRKMSIGMAWIMTTRS